MNRLETFKCEFKKWQYLFGLTGYQVYFEEADIDDAYADITTDYLNKIVTVRLDKDDKDVLKSAKHEAIHLLLAGMQHYIVNRFVSEDESRSVVEETVIKLEGIIR